MSRIMASLPLRLCLSVLLIGLCNGATIATAVDIGERAPDFTLPSTTGKTIRLSQYKNKKHVLLQFYTMDFNPV